MQSGNAVDKIKSGGGGEGEGGGKLWWYNYQQNFPMIDERDGFLAWLKGEFAAANVIIDALCYHLSVVGDAGEYDEVIGCIQQRRCNWGPVLYMQHFFPVSEVVHALEQAAQLRRQQRGGFEGCFRSGREYNRRGGGRVGQRFDGFKERKEVNSNNECLNLDGAEMERSIEDKKDISAGSTRSTDTVFTGKSANEPASVNNKNTSISKGICDEANHILSEPLPHENQKVSVVPKTFVANETFDGKTFNVVEGMKLYEELVYDSELSRLTALVNDLRSGGRRRQFNAQTYVVSKRPMRGRGREMIQFGLPIADAPVEDEAAERTAEPIPSLFQDVIEHLLSKEIVTVKPDSCIIDVFNEGDHSQPHMWPNWFGRPVCLLFLTDCELTFGRVISAEHPGDYKGSFKLSLKPGSVLTLQGRSADYARLAIPSLRKQRILVTMVKSEPKRITSTNADLSSSSGTAVSSNWVPPPSRSPNHFRPNMRPKHYGPVPSTGVLPPPPNSIPTILVPSPVATPVPFPAPVALPPAPTGWPAGPLRHPPPRLPVPGTGVFLPSSGSTTTSIQPVSTAPSINGTSVESHSVSEKDSNSNCRSSNGEANSEGQPVQHYGEEDGSGEVKSTAEEGRHQTADSGAAGKPDGTE